MIIYCPETPLVFLFFIICLAWPGLTKAASVFFSYYGSEFGIYFGQNFKQNWMNRFEFAGITDERNENETESVKRSAIIVDE